MRLHLHLVSDSTGETLEWVARAGIAQFDGVDAVKHYWPMVRTKPHLERIVEEIEKRPGMVLFTLVNGQVRMLLESRCRTLGIPAVAVLDPVIAGMSRVLGQTAQATPGRQHVINDAYFARVDAINYTLAHDDGQGAEDWEDADIVLAGVSRSSKTPTAIYLANRGYKVANIPLVRESPPPPALFDLQRPLIVGLTTATERLVAVRRNRVLALGADPTSSYVDPEHVAAEVAFARRIFADRGWPTIDVTRRSIEETAAEIINLHQRRNADEEEA